MTLATFTVPFLIGAVIGLTAGILLGAQIADAIHRRRLQALTDRLDRLERLLAGHPDFHWPTQNGHAIEAEDEVA